MRRQLGKPESVVSSVLGYEGPGSLLSYLKDQKGWVTGLTAAMFEEQVRARYLTADRVRARKI